MLPVHLDSSVFDKNSDIKMRKTIVKQVKEKEGSIQITQADTRVKNRQKLNFGLK